MVTLHEAVAASPINLGIAFPLTPKTCQMLQAVSNRTGLLDGELLEYLLRNALLMGGDEMLDVKGADDDC